MSYTIMTEAEEIAHYERNKENNLRYIHAKIVHATPKELALLAAFINGMGVMGWSDAEDQRPIQKEAQEVQCNE